MSEFTRTLSDELIEQLKQTKLFEEKLKPDIESGNVFPAIRGGLIEFYYKGNLLFKYSKNGFEANSKFLINTKSKQKYIKNDGETAIKSDGLIIENFYDGYDSIKQTINVYAKPEATLTSGFYEQNSFFKKDSTAEAFLIDIEAAFSPSKEDSDEFDDPSEENTNRIDTVFFDTVNNQIIFCEVKRFDDPRYKTSPKTDKAPKVIKQLYGYNKQIAKKAKKITQAYNNVFEIYHKLLGTKVYKVEKIYPQTLLFVAGFTSLYEKSVKEAAQRIETQPDMKVFPSGSVTDKTLSKICTYCRKKK
jgi:hypothetical protein